MQTYISFSKLAIERRQQTSFDVLAHSAGSVEKTDLLEQLTWLSGDASDVVRKKNYKIILRLLDGSGKKWKNLESLYD